VKPLMLEEIRQAVRGRWVARGGPMSVESVSTDTRTAGAGDLFIALRGERMDAHAFLSQAAEAGCAAAIVALDADLPAGGGGFPGGLIGVGDTTKALGELGAFHRNSSAATVVAVTGSNGKTTVKRMIHHILSRRLVGSCSPKSFNNEIGVPLTLLGVSGRDDYVVCELGSNAPGEIAALSAMCRPDVAVITCVSAAHLERLGSIEGVAAEKASILGSLSDRGLAVVWGDSELLLRAVRGYRQRTVRFGAAEDADLRLTGHEPRGRAQRFGLNGRLWVELPLPGRHNAMNAMAAIAVAQRFGIDQDEAAGALSDFDAGPMRLEWTEIGEGAVINDAYNANPSSVAAAGDVLAGAGGRRKVLIVGDMRELGEQAERLHRQTGAELAGKGIDLLIGVGSLGRYIAQGAAEAGLEAVEFDSVASAAEAVARLLGEGDTVLVKGSRAMAMEALIAPIRAALDEGSGAEADEKSEGQSR